MKKGMKILSVLLTVSMLFTGTKGTIYAEEGSTETESVTEKVTESLTELPLETAVESVDVTSVDEEPVEKEVTESETVIEKVTESVTEKVTEVVTEEVTEKVTEEVTETEKTTESESITEKVSEDVAEEEKDTDTPDISKVSTEYEAQKETELTTESETNLVEYNLLTTADLDEEVTENETTESEYDIAVVDDESYTFQVGLYSDSGRTQLVGWLTPDGLEISDWEYNTSLYLGINVEDLEVIEGVQYQIVIEMEPILYLFLNDEPELDKDRATKTYEKNDPLDANTTSTYDLKEYSLKNLTFLLNSNVADISGGLPLRYDNVIWNKCANASLGDGTNPLLTARLQKVEDGEATDLTIVKLQNATTGSAHPQNAYATLYSEIGQGYSRDIVASISEKVELNTAQMVSISYTEGFYYEDVEVVITLPEFTLDGVDYTMGWVDPEFSVSTGYGTYTTSEEDGVLIISSSNLYYEKTGIFNIWFSFPEELEDVIGLHTFEGYIDVYCDGINLISNDFKIRLDNRSQAIIKTVSSNGDANIYDIDTVQYLGTLAIRNEAAKGNPSGRLQVKLTFDENDTNEVGVTTFLLMMDTLQKSVTVNYTLVDENGELAFDGEEFSFTVTNSYYGKTDSDNMYKQVSRANLPTEHKGYYFKTVRYIVESVEGTIRLYHSSAIRQHGCAGTIWGYVFNGEVPSVAPVHLLEIYEYDYELEEIGEEPVLSQEAKVAIGTGTAVSYGIENPGVSSESIEAGEQVTISGRVSVVSYPYSSNNCLNDIRLGFVLPDGMEVNKEAIIAKFANGTSLGVSNISSTVVDTNKNFWIIEFEKDQKIGYANEQLGTIPNGAILNFSVTFNTSNTMPTQTLALKEIVFAAGKDRENRAGGSYSHYATTDTYDLNGNGSATDKIGCYYKETTTTVTINASLAEIEIYDNLSKEDGSTGNDLTFNDFADTINYELYIECNSGGQASNFFYLIPIAKEDSVNSSNFVISSPVSLEMLDEATVYNEQGTKLKVLYTTLSGLTYDTAKNATDWWETKPDGVEWSDVTMLKIKVEDEENPVMENGSLNMISVPIGYSGDALEYQNYAGSVVEWQSRGYYNYKFGVNNVSGHGSTEGCSVTLQYECDPQVIELTAAKNKEPINGSITDSFSIEINSKSQNYTISSISTKNVNIVSSESDFEGFDNEKSNTDFGVTVSVNGQSPVDILEDDAEIGSVAGSTSTEFVFEIYNANAISEIVTERTVDLIIIGDNGIIIPVEIIIYRELATAEVSDPAILAGKQYLPFTGGSSVVVSRDSAFTAEYVAEGLIPDNYLERTLSFSSALSSGTRIAMVDWSDESNPGYYFYEVSGSETEIPLTGFRGMGYNDYYTYPSGTEVVDEVLLFVVQLNGSEPIRSNTITLSRVSKATSDMEVQDLSFTSVEKRSFSLSPSDTNIGFGETFNISYSTVSPSGAESWYEGRKFSLRIYPEDGSKIPVDSVLKYSNMVYSLNTEGYFIVPLGTVQGGTGGSVALQLVTTIEKDISLKAELWVSATISANKPNEGVCVSDPVNISISTEVKPSYKVNSMSSRLLHKSDLLKPVTVECSALNVEKSTLEIQKKVESGYTTVTTALNTVNGNSTHEKGVFSIPTGNCSLTLMFSDSLSAGTYRILITSKGNGVTLEIPYNFIVAEDS